MELSNMNIFCKLTIAILRLPCLFDMAEVVSSTVVLVNSETSGSVNSFNFALWVLPASVSPWSWSNVLMDGEALDDER